MFLSFYLSLIQVLLYHTLSLSFTIFLFFSSLSFCQSVCCFSHLSLSLSAAVSLSFSFHKLNAPLIKIFIYFLAPAFHHLFTRRSWLSLSLSISFLLSLSHYLYIFVSPLSLSSFLSLSHSPSLSALTLPFVFSRFSHFPPLSFVLSL